MRAKEDEFLIPNPSDIRTDIIQLKGKKYNEIYDLIKRIIGHQFNRGIEHGIIGFILHGDVGTGKTTMVKALAKALNLPLFFVDGVDIARSLYGQSERQIGTLFEVASNRRSIILIDDAESVFPTRDWIKGQSWHVVLDRFIAEHPPRSESITERARRTYEAANVTRMLHGKTPQPPLQRFPSYRPSVRYERPAGPSQHRTPYAPPTRPRIVGDPIHIPEVTTPAGGAGLGVDLAIRAGEWYRTHLSPEVRARGAANVAKVEAARRYFHATLKPGTEWRGYEIYEPKYIHEPGKFIGFATEKGVAEYRQIMQKGERYFRIIPVSIFGPLPGERLSIPLPDKYPKIFPGR